MSLNWQNLRPLNNSQNKAFEALCCQLAEYERVKDGKKFFRVGAPDGGVECYWALTNDEELGWQAKFFLSPPTSKQWGELDKSVKTALKTHPRLISYTICLPIDRSDARIKAQKSFKDRWDEHVEKWEKWAQTEGMKVEFSYWGEHEILNCLSRPELRGCHLFWFNKELFSQEWFENRIEEAIANVGPRYTPELNVELPIAYLFDGLGRTPEFHNLLKSLLAKVLSSFSNARTGKAVGLYRNEFDKLQENKNQILSIVEGAEQSIISPIAFNTLAKLAYESQEPIRKLIQNLREAEEKIKREFAQKQKDGQGQERVSSERPDDFGYERHHLYLLTQAFEALDDFARGNEARLVNLPALLLVGNAGTGKTHLFCDIAKQRVKRSFPTILLLGGQFNNEEPWLQIIRLLGLSCTKEDFLGALEAAAQATGTKALILIDALNEGEGRKLWDKHLAGMLTTLSRCPCISFACNVRTSYENTVIPDGLVPEKLVRELHSGFAEHEYQATRTFFDYFGIEQPSVPLLVPEFQNPLFLKLFCQGLKNNSLTRVPSGLQGITAIFSFFADSVNKKLSNSEYLDFDPKSEVVQKAVKKLSEVMAEKHATRLSREEAQVAVNAFLPKEGYENSLFRHLIAEGLLAEDRYRIGDDEWHEGIHFSYERFADHFIAKHLLNKYLDDSNPCQSFLPSQFLGSFIKDEHASWMNRGLIEAFSIQLPERIGKELAEVAPNCADFQPILESFLESLVWRNPKAIGDATLRYVNEHIVQYKAIHGQFLNTLLMVASNPEHPYNADFLHNHLIRFTLAKRDAWWSIFLHYQYGEHKAVDRFVEWAWSSEDKSHIKDAGIRLCGIALSWFLTSSNRYLRDRTTKALVNLFTKRIHVLRQVIRAFLKVNDPYILERLFAVAYGCAMRSIDNEAIGKLAKDTYEWLFKNDEPPSHILLRDYARGVIELALHRGIKLEIETEKIRPPYKSEWPTVIPIEEDLKKHGERQEGMPDEEWARVQLYQSVMGFGDFARYIIGTNSWSFKWSSRHLGAPREPSRKEIYEIFVDSLTDRQKELWKQYQTVRFNVDFYRRSDHSKRKKIFNREFTENEFESAIAYYEQSVRKSLRNKKLKTFDEDVVPYINNPDPHKDEHRFDLSIAQRCIFQRVLDFGWSVKRFGRFDRNINDYDREGRKPERIGKKYQWIAYHEFLARVSDNFEFKGDFLSEQIKKYGGPWQDLYIRDIDPSFLLKKTEREDWGTQRSTWWFPIQYNNWNTESDDFAWLKKSKDLPAIESLIELTNPEDGSKWLNLEAFYRWQPPIPFGEQRHEGPSRDICYTLKSYIVRKQNLDELFQWAKKQDFIGRWMPESHESTQIFLGEFYWSPTYEYHNTPNYHRDEWTYGSDNRIPQKVLVTTDKYLQEHNGYDCSIHESIRIYLPAKWLVDHMKLRWNGIEGHFFDNKGKLVAFDPSVRNAGTGALLMNRDALMRFLNDNGYDILWTVLGEKIAVHNSIPCGRLEISGAYRIFNNKIVGKTTARFSSR